MTNVTEMDETAGDVPAKHFTCSLQCPSDLWSLQTFRTRNAVSYQTAEHVSGKTPPVIFHKMVVFEVDEQENSTTCSIFLTELLHCQRKIQSEEEAQDLLTYADNLLVCCGIGEANKFQPLDLSGVGKVSRDGLYARTCNGSVSQDLEPVGRSPSGSNRSVEKWRSALSGPIE
ncbi:hypothetical protein HPB47_015787 [Ixodes persulcatus]|uniref:Uncharacterized protein n=1 Tax=Ixodes persulcatus TaxID=34615 RepID=A0AC60QW58_IXOPE|nr:hypothetical protein HPB47_015787 [Ixodes persulcatus]